MGLIWQARVGRNPADEIVRRPPRPTTTMIITMGERGEGGNQQHEGTKRTKHARQASNQARRDLRGNAREGGRLVRSRRAGAPIFMTQLERDGLPSAGRTAAVGGVGGVARSCLRVVCSV